MYSNFNAIGVYRPTSDFVWCCNASLSISLSASLPSPLARALDNDRRTSFTEGRDVVVLTGLPVLFSVPSVVRSPDERVGEGGSNEKYRRFCELQENNIRHTCMYVICTQQTIHVHNNYQ